MTPLSKNNLAAPNIRLGDRGSLTTDTSTTTLGEADISLYKGELNKF